MSNVSAAFERALTTFSASDHLARFEAQCRHEAIHGSGHKANVYTPDSSYPQTTTFAGEPVEVRPMLRSLLMHSNGREIEPYSIEETKALTDALELRFGFFETMHNQLSRKYILKEDTANIEWREKFLDQLEHLMRGYVNLICQVNFEVLAEKDPSNSKRVEQFLAAHEEAIVGAFSNHGGAPAFLARTKGLDPHSRMGDRIFQRISNLDRGAGTDPLGNIGSQGL